MRFRFLSCLAGSLLLPAAAYAENGQCDSNPLYVLTSPPSLPLGGKGLLEFNTQHSIPGLLMVSLGCGPSSTPFGTFCLDFPIPFVHFFISDAAGYYSVPLTVPNNPKLDCLEIFMQFAVCNTQDPTQRGISNHINLHLGGQCTENCPETAFEDQYAQNDGGHIFYIPGLGADYRFINDTGLFSEHVDLGTGLLTGIIENEGEPGNQWDVRVEFSDRINPGDPNYPPPGSPYRQLDPSAYIENGGPVDTSTWYYYVTTVAVLTGLGNNAGTMIHFDNTGPAFQVGFGANGKNINYGGSGWLIGTYTDINGNNFNVGADINMDLFPCQ